VVGELHGAAVGLDPDQDAVPGEPVGRLLVGPAGRKGNQKDGEERGPVHRSMVARGKVE